MTTYLQLCKDTRQECGVQGVGPTAVTSQTGILARIVYWVKEADLYIQRLHPDWGFLLTEYTEDTVASSSALTQPTDLAFWDIASFGKDRGTSDGMPLGVCDYREWRNQWYERENQEPSRVVIKPDNTLLLENPADDVYEIYGNYWRKPVEMTADTSEPLYADNFQRAIVCKAK